MSDAYIFPPTEAEARRLEHQGARLYGGLSFLDAFLARGPKSVLDVGCGSGVIARQIAAQAPSMNVAGLDQDPSRLAFARAEAGRAGLRFEQGDMRAMPFPNETFDLVFSRFALVHCSDPSGTLREMVRVARPGAHVVAYEMVHEGIWFVPGRPAFAGVLQAIVALLRAQGAEPNQGLHLAPGLRRAGLADVGLRVISHQAVPADELYPAYRDNWVATLRHLRPALGPRLEDGQLEAAFSELAHTSGEELLVETTVLAWGQKRSDRPR